ncbi:MAG: ATP-binding protein [Mycoplasmataceae bacterium]|nr:ATP-binding protein [Mycoplasmataceae bacterium]
MIDKLIQGSIQNLNKIIVPEDFSNRHIVEYDSGNTVVLGMRRIGKSRYLKFRAQNLNLEDKEILFIDFDNTNLRTKDFMRNDNHIDELIEAIRSLLSIGDIKLVLLDEIQNVKGWSKLLKGFIDENPEVTFVATGSDSFSILNTLESGTGRFDIVYMGPLTYLEFKKMHPGKSFNDYINDYSLPQGPSFTLEQRFVSIIEKQIYAKSYLSSNVSSVIKSISLNPGAKSTVNSITNNTSMTDGSRADAKQVKKIVEFLMESNLIVSIEDYYTSIRSSKKTVMSLYCYDWNSYKYFQSIVTPYEELPSKIDKSIENKVLPTSGFVFENMIISNVFTILNTSLKRNSIKNKIEEPDLDLIIRDVNYEIKSFDVSKANVLLKTKIIDKSLETNSTIIHTGPSGTLDTNKQVKLINFEEFLNDLNK